MDAEALKIILELKQENVLMARAIGDVIMMLKNRKEHFTLEYGDEYINLLVEEVIKVLSELPDKPKTDPITVRFAD
ncbi:MAG TPA: hypothetical protein VHO50_07065 [Bacteroidales bacterium]|nr:hypothetical protein [Bacteroidales bacterium]